MEGNSERFARLRREGFFVFQSQIPHVPANDAGLPLQEDKIKDNP